MVAGFLNQGNARLRDHFAAVSRLVQGHQPGRARPKVKAKSSFVADMRLDEKNREILGALLCFDHISLPPPFSESKAREPVRPGRRFEYRALRVRHTRYPFQGLDCLQFAKRSNKDTKFIAFNFA